ncbi:hypothetical protein [Wenyingzhuangia sp. 2_MG-2023]|uniref:hypothetical protein n=1 Tax=Wenyingzhuangia sp. 2_MG-2023 TaxID=3062639 RepID=UPI0026E2ED1E|nr:hypothetical protein [Wenyingzhuangia sp. 2_MG-2023]MDO6739390.1 hypothetical protein [Wenyingzhuangia sp. 2_MG-2023]
MKNIILTLFLILFLINCEKKDSYPTELDNETEIEDGTIQDSNEESTERNLNWIRLNSTSTYDENGNLSINSEWNYDEKGREIASKTTNKNNYSILRRDYSYEDNILTVHTDTYDNGIIISSGKSIINYRDNYIKFNSIKSYDENENLTIHSVWTYDEKGREISLETYNKEKLVTKRRDYSYEDNVLTVYADSYNNGEITSSTKSIIDYRDNYIKFNSVKSYDENENLTIHSVWSYDEKGREINLETYNKGELVTKRRDYSYEDNILTVYTDTYNNGEISSSIKSIISYYNKID